jgi:hypothetical protein
MSLALDPKELQALTGYKIGAKQREWLKNLLGFDPPMGADGRPKVTETVVNQAMLARMPGSAQTDKPSGKPNWTK